MSLSNSVRRLAGGAAVLAVALAGTSPTFGAFVTIDTFPRRPADDRPATPTARLK